MSKSKEIEIEPPDEIAWHSLSMKEVLSALDSSHEGLGESQVVDKLLECGPNKLTIEERFKILKMLGEQFTDFLVILLIVAGFISLGIGLNGYIRHGEGAEIIDAIAIFAIVIINAIIGFVQDYRSNQALEKLKEYFEQEVLVIRDGQEKMINSCDLVPGDIIVLEMGDKVPADCRVIEANNFKVDEAPLTGESKSITKKIDLVPAESRLHERKNMIYMGTTCVYGRGKCIVAETGMSTEMGKIAELTQEKKELTPLQQALDRLGKVLGIIILAICGLVMIVDIIEFAVIKHMPFIEAFADSFETAIALAISAVPEGLPAAIVITLAIGVSKMAKKKTIVSRLPAVETLGSVDYICSDKTGTLTRNEMTVKEIWTKKGFVAVGGSGYLLDGDFEQDGKKIDPRTDKTVDLLLETAYHCNNSAILRDEGKMTVKGDPTEAALNVVAEKAGYTNDGKFERLHEFFFDSDRKRMSTIHKKDGKNLVYVKGSPPTIVARCDTIKIDGKTEKITKAVEEEITTANLAMAKKALRVLAIAYKEIPDGFDKENDEEAESQLVFLGLTGMIDPPRKVVKQSILECKEAGITTVMITGDQKETAVAVAEEIGIISSDDELVVNGDEFSLMTEDELIEKIEHIKVYSRMSPKDKFRVVETLQKLDHTVACTGDGVNDAPAIKKADIGVAMGITGTDVTKEVADMVITDDAFDTIVSAVEEGRNIFENMKKFIRYLLSCNFDEIFAVLIVTLAYGVLPFLPLQILFLNLLTDALPALALSFDPYDPELMKRPPRGKKSSFVKDMYVFASVAGLVALACSLGIFIVCFKVVGPNMGFDEAKSAAYGQTMAFVATLSFELWFVFIARNDNETSLIKSKPFKNTYLLFAVALSWVLLIGAVYIPGLQSIFTGFEEYYLINGRDWGLIFGFTLGLCAFAEIARYLFRTQWFKSTFSKTGLA